jgi:hypothetical protein
VAIDESTHVTQFRDRRQALASPAMQTVHSLTRSSTPRRHVPVAARSRSRVLCLTRRMWSSERRRVGDAWAHEGEEGRGKLRKARGSRTQALSPRWPNGATRRGASFVITVRVRQTRGTETSQYPGEEKSTEMPGVAASETGGAQTGGVHHPRGCRTHGRVTTKPAEVPWNGAPETVTAR